MILIYLKFNNFFIQIYKIISFVNKKLLVINDCYVLKTLNHKILKL